MFHIRIFSLSTDLVPSHYMKFSVRLWFTYGPLMVNVVELVRFREVNQFTCVSQSKLI